MQADLERKICLLEKELQDAKDELSKLVTCIHNWDIAISDPEEIQTEVRNAGVQEINTAWAAPKEVVVMQSNVRQRWSRTCMNCGEKQYTYETRAIKFEPLFR